MRTITAGERTLLGGQAFNVHVRVETTNALGLTIDVTELFGGDWFLSATWSTDLDNAVGQATLVFTREAMVVPYGLVSLSPLVGSSPANNGGPLFDYERPIRLRTACVAAGSPKPAANAVVWQDVFFGKISGIEAGGEQNEVQLACLDEGSREADAWVKDETEYGSDDGVPLETVMEQIRTDWAPFLPGLVAPSPSGVMVKTFKQEQASVLAARRDKLALLVGFDYRWRWTGRQTFVPVFQEPERDAPSIDAVFQPTEYVAIPRLGGTGDDIRNTGRIKYVDENGDVQTVEDSVTESVNRFGGPGKGERWFELTFGSASQIRTETAATKLLASALKDMAFPDVGVDVETTYWWPAEIGDYYQFGANQNQFTSDQTLAVIGITHTLSRTSQRTTFKVRGKPAAAYRRWLDLAEGLGEGEAVTPLRLKNFRVLRRTPQGVYVTWEDGDLPSRAQEIDVYKPTVPDGTTTAEAWPTEDTPPTEVLPPAGMPEYGPIPYPPLGSVTYAFFVPLALETLAPGDAEKVVVNSVGIPPHFGAFSFVVNPATGLVGNASLEVIDPQTFGGTLKAWVNHDSPEDADPAAVPDGTLVLTDTPYTVTFADAFATAFGSFNTLRDIRVRPNKNKRVFFEFTNINGVSSGVRSFTIIGGGGVIDETGNIVDKGIISARQFVDTLRPYGIYTDLPTNPDELGIKTGDLIVLFDADHPAGILKKRTATGWTNAIDFQQVDGQIIEQQLSDGAVGLTKFAETTAPVAVVADFSAPPPAGASLGFDGTDLKRWVGGAWTNAVPAVNITGQITEAQLAVNAISSRVLGTLAITSTNIADGAITTPKLFAGAVTTAALAAGAVTATNIQAGAVTAVAIAAGSITGDRIAANTISAGNILGRTITAGLIAVGAVTATEIASRTIVADRVAFGTLTSTEIAARTILATNIKALEITGNEIKGGTISGDKLIANTIQAGGISAGGITAIAIAAKAVKASMMEVAVLSDIKDADGNSMGLGIVVSGRLNAVASGAYLDLNATGTLPVFHANGLELLANGSAWFSGDVRSTYFLADTMEVAGGLTIGSQSARNRSPFFVSNNAIKFYDPTNTVFNTGTAMWLKLQGYGNELWSFWDLYIKVFTGRTVYFTSDSGSSGSVAFNVATMGFFNVTPVGRQTISSTRAVQTSGYIPALFDLLQALDRLGLIHDLSTL